MNEETIFGYIGCLISLFLIGMGFLMRRRDFTWMLQDPCKKDNGLYLRWGFKLKRLGDATPENRQKYSKYLGNFFIVFSALFFISCIIIIIT